MDSLLYWRRIWRGSGLKRDQEPNFKHKRADNIELKMNLKNVLINMHREVMWNTNLR